MDEDGEILKIYTRASAVMQRVKPTFAVPA